MFYLKVNEPDEDFDLFSFSSMNRAIQFIMNENKENWILSDKPFEEYPLTAYVYIEE